MGKSSKKIKSDRINVLRKQYDAFLEEDKKRKERNEFILGRLDKMRFSTAMLPLRHKPGIIPDTVNRIGQQNNLSAPDYRLSRTNPTEIAPDFPLENIEETFLIQEISKKYILIPKLRSTYTNNYVHDIKSDINIVEPIAEKFIKKDVQINDDNADWKSKYDILNSLKREEKDEVPIQFKPEPLSKPDEVHHVNKNYLEIAKNPVHVIGKNDNTEQKFLNELPEKDLQGKISYESFSEKDENSVAFVPSHQYKSNDRLDTKQIIGHGKKSSPVTISENLIDPVSEIDNKLHNMNLKNNDLETLNTSQYLEYEQTRQTDVINTAKDNHDQLNVDMINAIENGDSQRYNNETQQLSGNDPADHDKDQVITENDVPLDVNRSHVERIIPNDFVEEITKGAPSVEPKGMMDNIEYPIDIIDVQEFTPNEDVQLMDGVNVNTEGHIMAESKLQGPNQEITQKSIDIQEPVDISGIKDFEAEQHNMFYSEQTDENYAYEGGAGATYNEGYDQSESYQQNQEYVYYDGMQPEVYQPVEINEHEETTQQYDQNYEQQYVGTYEQGYEQQQQLYDHSEQQYQETGVYPSQPDVEQMHYEQQNDETLEQVQQVLDNEQGYPEVQNIVSVEEEDNAANIVQADEEGKAANTVQVEEEGKAAPYGKPDAVETS